MLKIGIVREEKSPPDSRTPLIPNQAKYIQDKFDIKIVVQSSELRCFSDQDYQNKHVSVVNSLSDCDIIFGVKEVPMAALIPNKNYFFFSHIIKKQLYNKKLLQAILAKKIKLIDWETIKDTNGNRLIAFGRWAGIVGAYNGLIVYGKRYQLYDLKRAYKCFDFKELANEYTKIKIPNLKILITGGGRVAHGANGLLQAVGIKQVNPHDFLHVNFDEPVFAQLYMKDYHVKKTGGIFIGDEFHQNPKLYDSILYKFTKMADILIAGAYWSPNAPKLFTKDDMKCDDFNIKIISDITCDIDGSIPSTQRASTIADPFYDYNPSSETLETAFSSKKNITVSAVDNLPCELPKDASEDFGDQIIKNVLPHIINQDKENILTQATITESGKITSKFRYLQSFAEEN